MEGVLEDIYLGRDRARVFLQQWGLWEEDIQLESNLGDSRGIGESKIQGADGLGPNKMPEDKATPIQEPSSTKEYLVKEEISDEMVLQRALSKQNKGNLKSSICGICSKTIKNKRFRGHVESHIKSKLTWYHMEKQKGLKHMCDECGNCFTHSIILKAHIKDRHSGKTYLCDKCDFTCNGPSYKLVIHKKIKHGLSSYICPLCTFKSTSDTELEQHKQTNHQNQMAAISKNYKHEKARKEREAKMVFICKICQGTFKSRQLLGLHIQSDHKGIRYKCNVGDCKFSGKQRGSLTNHINSIHLRIKHRCKICEYQAGQTSLLRTHMIMKHNMETNSCNSCSFRCQDIKRMQKHVLQMHHK